MELYLEMKRERRIRDFRRMVRRAYTVTSKWWTDPRPSDRSGPRTWDEVLEYRWRDARIFADNLKPCPRSRGSGNSRSRWGDRTLQECRQSLAAIEQLVELGRLDDSAGQRDVRRRGPWV